MTAGPRRLRDPGSDGFVALVWIGSLLAGLLYAWRFAADVPIWDDMSFLPMLTGETAPTPDVLWAQDTAHRYPLVRAVAALVHAVTGRAFRVVPLVSVAVLGAASGSLLIALRRRRGRWIHADAVVPLAFLGLGPAVSLLRTALLTGPLHALAGALALSAVLERLDGPRRARLAAAAVLLAALTNANGVLLALPLAGWVLWLRAARGPGAVTRGSLAATILGVGHAVFVLATFRSGVSGAGAPEIGAALRVALQAAGMAFGPAAGVGWVESGFGGVPVPVFSIAAIGAFLLVAVLAARRAVDGGAVGASAVGLLAVAAGLLAQWAAVGWGRAALRPDFGLQNHYTLYSCLLLPALHVAAELGRGARRRSAVQVPLLAVLCALSVFHLQLAVAQAKRRAGAIRALVVDVEEGMPVKTLAGRHTPFLHATPELAEEGLRRLRDARMPPF